MGSPKLAVNVLGVPLIDHVLGTVAEFSEYPSVVVLGANQELYKERVNKRNIPWVFNRNWVSGMASSLISGLNYLEEQSGSSLLGSVIILADMPLVDSNLISSIIQIAEKEEKGIIACKYSDSHGPPALFKKSYFDQMKLLEGDRGAKKIIDDNLDDTEFVTFPKGVYDINTPSDIKGIHSL